MSVVALVGMMGSGKSAVASAVARRTGWALVDLDERIATSARRSIAELFAVDGEPNFRTIELDALRSVFDGEAPVVVATGGGIVTTAAGRRLLVDHATVVWLDASTDVLVERVGAGEGRPLLAEDPASTLRALAEERRELYAEVADVVVDANVDDVEVVAERVLSALGVAA